MSVAYRINPLPEPIMIIGGHLALIPIEKYYLKMVIHDRISQGPVSRLYSVLLLVSYLHNLTEATFSHVEMILADGNEGWELFTEPMCTNEKARC